MPAHVVCPTLSTMCSELLSGRPRAEGRFDDDRYVRLLAVDPVGLWTAQMFLIHQLRRSDVLPAGDLGIRRAVQRCWSPDRTYAAALPWASLRAGPGH
jgi:3-methyladenine DNA glycosylase/8-oxoguanine DNA glycosylase